MVRRASRSMVVKISTIVAACWMLVGVAAMLVGLTGSHRALLRAGLLVTVAGVGMGLASLILRPSH